MEVTINIIEVASDLAHAKLLEEVGFEESILFTEEENGDLHYKENYQDLFNEYYDEFFEAISNKALNIKL